MARFLRSTTASVLRPPVIVGPVVTFLPPAVSLAPSHPPPTKVTYRLGAPVVVAPSVTFGPVMVRLTPAWDRNRRRAQFRLGAPILATPTAPFAPVTIRLARSRRQQLLVTRVRPPAVVAPSVTFRPLLTRLAWWRRPRPGPSTLRQPTVTAATAPFRPVTIRLARTPARRAVSVLRAPAAVGPSITFTPVRVRLAQATLAPRKPTSSKLRPAVFAQIAQVLAPVLVRLARARAFVAPRSRLRTPTVTAPAVTFRPVRTILARRPRQAGNTRPIVGKIVPGLALLLPSFWLEGDPASGTLDDRMAGSTLDLTRGTSTLDPTQAEGNMDNRSGSTGIG